MEIPGYTILRPIGKGGMATVYLAIQESLDRQVALKVMQSNLLRDENFTERFLKEGRIIAQFQHPQIITIYDFGSHDSHYYFSMEFLPEGTLAQQIERGLSLERALDIIKLIAGALAYAHRRGVIHRDIKPQNILFRQDGTPVLSDFGIAKMVDTDTQLTAPGLAIGSPVYMSPEQITGQKLDSRSDLYSLGIVFYEMLARRPPYRADDVISIALMHCTQPVPPLPGGFSQLQPTLQKLLAKNPADRFASAEQFIQALDQAGTGRSFYSLHDTTRIVQSFKNSLRSKGILLVGGLSLLVLAVAGAVYSTLFHQLRPPDPETGTIVLPPLSGNRSTLTTNYEKLAVEHFEKNEFGQSLELIKLGLNTSPDDVRLLALRERVQQYQDAARLLEQARQLYQDGRIDESQRVVEEGLRRAPDHSGLTGLRDTLQAQVRQRRQQADQLLVQAHARWQEGDLEGSLKLAEEGLQRVADHPELSTLREAIQGQLGRRQRIGQLLAQARDLWQRGELDESLQRIEQGLSLDSGQPDLLNLRDRVKAAMETNNQIAKSLRDCATRFPLDRLSVTQGEEAAACYNQVIVLAPDNGEARARLEQVANRIADLASGAIRQADFQLAGEYLAQLGRIKPDHPQLAGLNRDLRAKREQAASPVRQKPESVIDRPAVTGKHRPPEAPSVIRPPGKPDTDAKPSTSASTNPARVQPVKPAKPVSELAGKPRQKGPGPSCREALLKAQLGEPLSTTEQEACKP